MKRHTGNLAVNLVATAVALVTLVLLSAASRAEDLVSTSLLLRGGTLSGGGEVALQSTAPTPTIGSGGVTIGQPGPIGVSSGPTSEITLHAGFWFAATGEIGVPDSDGDGLLDAFDNCMDIANGPDAGIGYSGGVQVDTDMDGYGNPCDGDFDQSNTVGGGDFSPLFLADFTAGTDSGIGTDMDCGGSCAGTVPCP
jgi:hypothetical protein